MFKRMPLFIKVRVVDGYGSFRWTLQLGHPFEGRTWVQAGRRLSPLRPQAEIHILGLLSPAPTAHSTACLSSTFLVCSRTS